MNSAPTAFQAFVRVRSAWNRLTGLTWSQGGAPLDGQQRSLDLGNRVIARQRALDATGEVFSHDGHHRMAAWWQGVPNALAWSGAADPATWTEVERYTLDDVLARQQTERQSFGGSPVTTAYVQNPAHFPVQVGAEARTTHHGFLNGDGTFFYRWDAWGRLTEVREAASGLVRRSHLYDAEGRRVRTTETEGGVTKTTRHVYWGQGLAASYDVAGGNTRTYGFVGGADGESFVRVQQNGADHLFELARDFQGSVLALIERTNPSQVAVAERYRYGPFGAVTIEAGGGQPPAQSAFGNERFFLGRLWDAEIGIYDLRARWYEPDVGGFLAPDPLGAVDSWNLFQYGLAEPNSVFDSTGRQVIDDGIWVVEVLPESFVGPPGRNQVRAEDLEVFLASGPTSSMGDAIGEALSSVGLEHEWIEVRSSDGTPIASGGMAPADGSGEGSCCTALGTPTELRPVDPQRKGTRTKVPGVDGGRFVAILRQGGDTGRWYPLVNDCHGVASDLLTEGGAGRWYLERRTGPLPLYVCFASGTLVATEHELAAIEDIQPGDRVWAYDIEKSMWVLGAVDGWSQHYSSDGLVRISLEGETLISTRLHPFWVISGTALESRLAVHNREARLDNRARAGRWVEAQNLRPGDLLLGQAGTQITVVDVRVEDIASQVYNLRVRGYRNFLVGASRVLVHNS